MVGAETGTGGLAYAWVWTWAWAWASAGKLAEGDMAVVEGNGGSWLRSNWGGAGSPSTAVGELELWRAIEFNEGEKSPRGGNNGVPDPCGQGWGVVPVPVLIGKGVVPVPVVDQKLLGVYGGNPVAEVDEIGLMLEEMGLSVSPGMFDGGVNRFPKLTAAGGSWVLRAEVPIPAGPGWARYFCGSG